jgi:hypothetical protein
MNPNNFRSPDYHSGDSSGSSGDNHSSATDQEQGDLDSLNDTNFPSSSSPPVSLHAWVDIFAASKLVVYVNPRNLSNPYIMIKHAQKEFLHNFGFSEEHLPIPLSSLFGPSTERTKIIRLEQSLLTGRPFSEFLNLHKSNGGSLSCYVSLLCLTTQKSTNPGVVSSSSGGKFGVLTIRSASVVGNSKYSGMGLMGTDRLTRERIQESLPTTNKVPAPPPPSSQLFASCDMMMNTNH